MTIFNLLISLFFDNCARSQSSVEIRVYSDTLDNCDLESASQIYTSDEDEIAAALQEVTVQLHLYQKLIRFQCIRLIRQRYFYTCSTSQHVFTCCRKMNGFRTRRRKE